MKISEMSTRQAAECLCKISAPLGRIGEDEAVIEQLKEFGEKAKGQAVLTLVTGMASKFVPLLLDTHYEDTVEILAAMTGKTAVEIGEQSVLVTLKDARESVDKDLIDFFTASVGSARGR